MIDIGFLELCLILILLLFVVGPEELPQFFAKLGRFIRNVKRLWQQADNEIKQVIDPQPDYKALSEKYLKHLHRSKKEQDDDERS